METNVFRSMKEVLTYAVNAAPVFLVQLAKSAGLHLTCCNSVGLLVLHGGDGRANPLHTLVSPLQQLHEQATCQNGSSLRGC